MQRLVLCLSLLTLASCNVFAPLDAESSDQDFLEAAQKCLHDGDYACAISYYQRLSEGDRKNQNLCTTYLAKAGMDLPALLDVVTQQSSTMMGRLAAEFLPWNPTRTADAEAGKNACLAYAASGSSGNAGVLLRTLGLLVDCATRIAKTDVTRGSSDSDTDCATAGDNSGTVVKSDIEGTGGEVMCSADVAICRDNISSLDAGELGNAELTDIQGALDQIPSDLKNSGAAIGAVRTAIKSAIPN